MIGRSSAPLGAARERQRGQVLVLFAFVLIALLLISALAVDYGGWLLARRSYQNIADEAALAGAQQLTNPNTSNPNNPFCQQGGGVSKQVCAREAAWASIKNHLAGFPFDPLVLGATSSASLAVTWSGYTFWVASPPSDAGSAYTGNASSTKTIFVRVERVLNANLSRIVRQQETVGAWATAGRIPESFAIILLCQGNCLGGGADGQVAGTGSNLILESGDLGSNSWTKTSGNSASVALCDEQVSLNIAQCSAYMHDASQCSVSSSVCQLDRWTGSAVDTSTRYSGLALPQVIDPEYTLPTLSSTTTPYQCYSTLDSPPAISMAAPAEQLAGRDPYILAAAQLPPTPAPVALASTAAGKVTAAVGGAGVNGIKVTLTPGGYNNTTSGGGPNAGGYSITGVPGGTYTLTATDATGTYHEYTQSVTVPASGTLTTNFSIKKNPIITGTVTDSASSPVSGATVTGTISGTGGGTWTATTAANGTYTLVLQPTSAAGNGPYTANVFASASGYTNSSTASPSVSLDATFSPQNFVLTANPGSISGQVTSGGSPLAGVTVTWSKGATGGAATTDASGNYTITGAVSGSGTVTASLTGYTTGTSSQTLPPGGTLSGVNFSLISNTSSITGHVYDQTTGLALPNVTVSATNGVSSGSATTNSAGLYLIGNLTPSNPKYDVTATITGWTTKTQSNKTVNAGANTIDFAATAGNGLWPANCGTSGANKGNWDCDNGTGCTTVVNPTGVDVGCSSYSDANRIRPGTYKSITVGANECAWIDPVGGVPGLTSGQSGGVVYITDTLSVGSNAFIVGDGVSVVLAAGAHADVNNAGGFVFNYGGSACPIVTGTNTPPSCSWRTANYIGNNTGTQTFSACGTDTDGFADLRRAAFTTGGTADVARLTWDTSGGTPCYQDGDEGSYLTTNKGEIGVTVYLRDSPTCCGGHRFAFSGLMGFLFDGVLYGPKDDIDLGGQGGQAAAGQIVAWTLKYHGDTDIHQRYLGVEIDGSPYLIEPYIGE